MIAEMKTGAGVYARGKFRNFTEDEYFAIMDKQFEAFDRGDMEEFARIGKQLPIDAYIAKSLRDIYGSRFVRESGLDVTEAELLWGKDWLDEGPEEGIFPYAYPGKP